MVCNKGGSVRSVEPSPRSISHISTRGRQCLAVVVALAIAALPAPALPSMYASFEGVTQLDDLGQVLNPEAAKLSVTHRGRKTAVRSIDKRLTPAVRSALNTWAETAQELELRVAVPETAEALVLGTVGHKVMDRTCDVLDETWELLEPLMSERPRKKGPAVLVLLFDQTGFQSEAWGEMLGELVAAGLISDGTGAALQYSPGGLTIFSGRLFIQPIFDQAGDSSAGDDEFRLENELAHKLTISLVRSRFGQLPECMRWGMGYVAEQRLFRSIYQFNRVGFVASEEHFGWPKRARAELKKLAKRPEGLRFSDLLTVDASAGKREPPQLASWGVLDYLLAREPEALSELLTELAELHDVAARNRAVSSYVGAESATKTAIDNHLAELSVKQLDKHLKRVK